MITAAVSVYDLDQTPPLFVAVVGLDVTTSTLRSIGSTTDIINAVVLRSNKVPFPYPLSPLLPFPFPLPFPFFPSFLISVL